MWVVICAYRFGVDTKEFISMSSGDSDDELYDSTNHIMSAIEDHDTRIVRLEDNHKHF